MFACRRIACAVSAIPRLASARRGISIDPHLITATLSGLLGGAIPTTVNYLFSRRIAVKATVAKELSIVFFSANAFQSRIYNILAGEGKNNFLNATPESREEFILYTSFVMARFIALIESVESGVDDIRFFTSKDTAKLAERLQRIKMLVADNTYGDSPLVLFRSHQLGIAAEMGSPKTDFVTFTMMSSKPGYLHRLKEKVSLLMEGLRPEWLPQLISIQAELIEIMLIIDPRYKIIASERRLKFVAVHEAGLPS